MCSRAAADELGDSLPPGGVQHPGGAEAGLLRKARRDASAIVAIRGEEVFHDAVVDRRPVLQALQPLLQVHARPPRALLRVEQGGCETAVAALEKEQGKPPIDDVEFEHAA